MKKKLKMLEATMYSIRALLEFYKTEEIRDFLDYLMILYDREINKEIKDTYYFDPGKFITK